MHPRRRIRDAFASIVRKAWSPDRVDVRTDSTSRLESFPAIVVSTPTEQVVDEDRIPEDIAFSGANDFVSLTVQIVIYLATGRDGAGLVDEMDDRCDAIERSIANSDLWPPSVYGSGGVRYESFDLEESPEGYRDVTVATLLYSVTYARGDLRT